MAAQEEPISLAECHRRLVTELGDQAPADITLKRWKKDGKLKKAAARGTGSGRTARYHFVEVLKIAKGVSLASRPTAPRRVALQSAGEGLSPAALQQIAHMFAHQIATALKNHTGAAPTGPVPSIAAAAPSSASPGLPDGVRELKAAADNLEATRRMLMNRYDSEITALRSRVLQLTEDLRTAQSNSLDTSRMTQRLGTVIGLLESKTAP